MFKKKNCNHNYIPIKEQTWEYFGNVVKRKIKYRCTSCGDKKVERWNR